MKIADFETAVRDLISDAVGGDSGNEYRWSAAIFLLWLNEGRKLLFKAAPEAFYVDAILTAYPGDLGTGKDTDLDPMYDSVLVNYCVYRCLSRDNEDPETGRLADGYLKKFMSGM